MRAIRWKEPALYCLIVAALYWPAAGNHYVWDDWLVQHEIWLNGIPSYLANAWNPAGAVLYRPLARMMFVLYFSLFGFLSIPGNILRLALLALNGFLCARVARQLGARDDAATLAGVLLVSLATLHIDPLLWLVGLYDIATVTFSLLAVEGFLRRRLFTSLTFLVCALLMKEAGAFLPPLLLFWAIAEHRPRGEAIGYSCVALIYGAIKLMGTSPLSVGRENSHEMTLDPQRLFVVLREYLTWLAGSFLPFATAYLPGYLVLAECVVVGVLWSLLRKNLRGGVPASVPWTLLFWGSLALLPALPLLHQSTRYAVVHASVPLCLLLAIAASEFSEAVLPRYRTWVLGFIGTAVFAANLSFSAAAFSQGLKQPVRDDGWFHLVRRAAAVDSVYVHLFDAHPSVPAGSRIHITGIPLTAIGDSAAVQIWYRDTTLKVDGLADTSRSPDAESGVTVTVSPPLAR